MAGGDKGATIGDNGQTGCRGGGTPTASTTRNIEFQYTAAAEL